MMMDAFIDFLDNYWLAFVFGVLLSSAILTALCARYRHYPELDKGSNEDAMDDDRVYDVGLFWLGVSAILVTTVLFVLGPYNARPLDIHEFRWYHATSVYVMLLLVGFIAILESYGYAPFNSCRINLLLAMAWMAFFDDPIPTEAPGFLIRLFHVHVLAVWINLYDSMYHSNATSRVANGATLVSALLPPNWNIALGIPMPSVSVTTRLYCDYGIICLTVGVSFIVICMNSQLEHSMERNKKEQEHHTNDLKNDLEQPLLPNEKEVIVIGVGVMMDA